MAQLGIDLVQAGTPVFVAWDDFLECVTNDASRGQCHSTYLNTFHRDLEKATTPTRSSHKRTTSHASSGQADGSKTEVHDTVVDVVFSANRSSANGLPRSSRHVDSNHVQAQMIISVWASAEDVYYTLTFTASSRSGLTPMDGHTKTTSRTVSRHSTSLKSGMSSESSSSSGRHKSSLTTSAPTSITSYVLSPRTAEILPKGPPGASTVTPPTMFRKTNRLKDAILNTMNIPAYAMWKDESFGVPNKAAIKLIFPWIENGVYDSSEQAKDFLSKFSLWDEDFTTEIPREHLPILRVLREQKRFDGYRVGMYSPKDGSRLLFDASGEPILDENGEFLGGLVLFNDVTDFVGTIDRQQKENEMQFENLCNMVSFEHL